jgi:hypothetical protein
MSFPAVPGAAPSFATEVGTVAKNPTPGEIVVMAGAGVALLFSFFPFYELEILNQTDSTSAWGSGLFPVATLIPIFALIAGVLVALVRFGNVQYPPGGFLGIGYDSLLLVVTFFSALLAVSFLIKDRQGFDFGFGFWFMLIGAVASLAGAIVMTTEAKAKA